MPTNKFFRNYTSKNEQKLIEDLIIEQIQINGIDIVYAPASAIAKDKLLGEDPCRAFNRAYTIESYFENVDGFHGMKDFVGRLGGQIDKKVTFIVSKRRFEQIVKNEGNNNFHVAIADASPVRPNEGDWIYFPLTHEMFEINFANHESVFYQLGKIYVWKLECTMIDFSNETVNTGNKEIDALAVQLQNNNSTVNDPGADNIQINTNITSFLGTDSKNPQYGGN